MLGAAVVGGLILAMIEGIGLGMSRITGQMMLNEQCMHFFENISLFFIFI